MLIFLNEFSYYPVGGLASQALSGLAGGCGRYQVGYLWANTATENMTEDAQFFNEDLHSKPQYLENTSFSLEQTPFQLPVTEDGVIWGWPSRGGQLVSMLSWSFCVVLCQFLPFDCVYKN